MNSSNGVPGPQALPPLTALIKPQQIANVPGFNETLRTKYMQGITNLWQTVRSHPEDSPEHQNAHKKLAEVTSSIREHMRKAALNASANGNRSANPGQPVQDGRAAVYGNQGQQPIQSGQPPKPEQQAISQRVANLLSQMNILVPPNVSAQGQERAQNWLREAKQRYAFQATNHEKATNSIRELVDMVNARQREGGKFSPEETQQIQVKKQRLETMQSEAKEFVTRFRNQQEQLKQSNAVRDLQVDGANAQDSRLEAMEGATEQQAPQQPTVSEHQGHKDVNSALDAARQHTGSTERNAMSPISQSAQTATNFAAEPSIKKEPQSSQSTMDMNTSGPPMHHNSPQVGQPNTQTMPTSQPRQPYPLSHRDAMQAAQTSYSSQPNYQTSSSQPPTHGHPQLPNRGDPPNSNVKMPIPKDLKIAPPQPVTMGSARPTLTGGPSNGAIGQLGQPAIQKHPGYVLEGDGERVLSKKKLQELVKQVTGVGGEGDDTEGLTPEVEETLLQVADDFVDQVVSSACKLAKLRSSSTLEIRDLQLILERNYNIRVPGYASDELRTVKKVQPTQAWTQKLSAVQAAKVTGGKTDL